MQFEDLSVVSKGVLFSIAGSFIGVALTIVLSFLKAIKKLIWKGKKTQKGSKTKITDSAASAQATQAEEINTQPERHSTIPYKQLVHKSKASKNKKHDEGKILEHPFYIFCLKDHRDGVHGFAWARDGSAIASACEDRCVRLFSFSDTIDKGISTRQINIQGTPIDVGFLNDSSSLVVLCKGFLDTATLMFYNNQAAEIGGTQWICTKTIEKVFGTDRPLRLETVMNEEAGKLLIIVCSASKEAKVYDVNGVALSNFAPNSFVNHDLAVSYNAQLASIATFTADAKVWELKFTRDGVYRSSLKVMDLKGHRSKVMTVAFSMDATRAVSISEDGVMKIWNVDVQYNMQEDPRCLLTVQLLLKEGEYYHRMAFGPDNALAAALQDSIHFIDIQDGAIIGKVEHAHDGPITCLHWASKELKCKKGTLRVLASSSRDKRVRMWAHPEDI